MAPDHMDVQINPHPRVERWSTGKFRVQELLVHSWLASDGPHTAPMEASWRRTLSVECSYCHRTLEVILHAPSNVAKFVEDEACRLAILEHLRTEHPTSKKQ